MSDVNANIDININSSNALAQLKSLQRQIAQFHTSIAKSSESAALAQRGLQKNLLNSINAINGFTAEMRTVKTSAESFTNSLEKNKFSMREYFRYAGASTKTFGRLFKSEFDTIGKVAEERVKRLQTQYVKMGRDANGAMQAIAVTPTSLNMKDYGTQTAIAAQKQALFNQLMKQGSTNLLNFGKNTQWAGRQLMVGFTIPLAMVGSAATKTFMEMEAQAIKFKKVYGDLFTPKEETQQALDNVLELGRSFTKYGVAVSATVGLAAEAAAAGFSGLDLQRQTTEATRLSILGQIDNQKALETTISLQNAFGMSSDKLADSINFLNAVENQTVVSLDDITTAIPKVAPVIQQLGGDVKDLTFFLAAMKEGGINASEGANALKSGLAALINPTGRASAMLAQFGINATEIVTKNKGNLKATVVEFATALNQLDPLNRAQAIEQMFGKFQFARLSTLFANVAKDGNQAARVLDLANSSVEELSALSEQELGMTAESAMNKFKKTVEDLKIALVPVGKAFLEAVTPIVEFVGNILEKFGNLSDGTKKVITLLTVGIGAVGPVLLMTFGLLANGVANIIKLFLTLRGGYQRLTGQSQILGEQTQYMTMEQIDAAAAAHSLNQTHATLTQTFTAEAGAIQKLIAAYSSAAIASTNFARLNPGMMMSGRGVTKLANGIVSVPGPKGAGDIIPAMLSPGEAVVPADMAKKYAPLINGMIAGNIPGYEKGKSIGKKVIIPGGMDVSHFSKQEQISGKNLIAMFEGAEESIVNRVKDIVNSVKNGQEKMFTIFDNQVIAMYSEINRAMQFEGEANALKVRENLVGKSFAPVRDIELEKQFANAGHSVEEFEEANKQITKAIEFEYDQLRQTLRYSSEEWESGYDRLGNEITITSDQLDKLVRKSYETVANSNTKVKTALTKMEQISTVTTPDVDLVRGSRVALTPESFVASKKRKGTRKNPSYKQRMTDLVGEDNIPYNLDAEFVIKDKALNELKLTGDQAAVIFKKMSDETKIKLAKLKDDIKEFVAEFTIEAAKVGEKVGTAAVNATTKGIRQPFANSPEYVPKINLGGPSASNLNINPSQVNRLISGQTGVQLTEQQLKERNEKALARIKRNSEELANRAIESTAKAAGTKSPSKRTIPIGEDIARGLEVGMANRQDDVALAGSQLSQAATGGTSRGSRKPAFRPEGPPRSIGVSDPALLAMAYQENAMRDKINKQAAATQVMTQRMDKLNKGFMSGTFAISALSGVASMAGGNLGKFSEILFQITGPLFALSSILQLLTGTKILDMLKDLGKLKLGLIGVGITALGVGIKLFNDARERERIAIEGLGDAATLTQDKLKKLGSFFGVNPSKTPFESTKPTLVTGKLQRSELESLKADSGFQETFKKDIEVLKGASDEQAKLIFDSLAIQLRGRGYAANQVKTILKALQEESGKTSLKLKFKNLDLTTPDGQKNLKKNIDSIMNTYRTSFKEGYEEVVRFVDRASTRQAPLKIIDKNFSDELNANADFFAKQLTGAFNAISGQLADGVINAEQFSTSFNLVSDSIKSMPAPEQLLILNDVMSQLPEDLKKAAAGIDNVSSRLIILKAQALGVSVTAGVLQAMTLLEGNSTGGQSAIIAAQRLAEFEKFLKLRTELIQKANEIETDPFADDDKVNPIVAKTKAIQVQTEAYEILRKANVDNATATELSNDAEIAAIVIANNKSGKLENVIVLVDEYKAALEAQTKAAKDNMSQEEKFKANLTRTLALANLREKLIDLDYAPKIKKETDELKKQQKELKDLNNEIDKITRADIAPKQKTINANNFALEKISLLEDEINEKYEKQIKALEKIETLNQDISNAQKQRLGIADALTSGDISRAVQLMQDASDEKAASAASRRKNLLTERRDAEIEALGRKDLEKENKKLQFEISEIERGQLLNFREQKGELEFQIGQREEIVDNLKLLADELKDAAFYAGQTKTALEDQDELVRLADAAGIEYNDTLIKQLANAQGIQAAIEALNTEVTTIHNIKTVNSGAQTGTMLGSTFIPSGFAPSKPPASKAAGVLAQFNAAYRSKGGLIPKYMAVGGKAVGSDTVPAMLTPGEFIVNRAAASANGPMLKSLNESKYPSMLGTNSSPAMPVVNSSTSLSDNSTAVYNYTLGFNINGSTSNPNDIARAVIKEIKQIDSQRIGGRRR